MAKHGNRNAWLEDALRDLFGGSFPQSTDQRRREEFDTQKNLDTHNKQQQAQERQQLIDIIKRQYSKEAVPHVLDAIDKGGNVDDYVGTGTERKTAEVENALDKLLNRTPPTPKTPTQDWLERTASQHRAKQQNALDAALGRETDALPVDMPDTMTVKNAGDIGGPGIDKLAELLQQNKGAFSKDPRKQTAFSAATGAVRLAGGDVTALPQLISDAAKLFEEKQKAVIDSVKQMGAGLGTTLTEQKAGKIISGSGNTLEGTGKFLDEQLPGSGTMFKAVGQFNKALGDSVENIREWGKNLHSSNMEFSEFSGGMAAVGARQMVRDILLSQERGNRRSATAEYEAKGKHELEKAFAPFEDLFANFQNLIAGRLETNFSKLVNAIGDKLNIKGLNQQLGQLAGGNKDQDLLQSWLNKEANNEQDFSQYGRPKRHQYKP